MKNFRSLRNELSEAPDKRELSLVSDDEGNETPDNRQAERAFFKKHVVHFMRHPQGNEHVFSGSRDPVGPSDNIVTEELIREGDKEAYQKFFKKTLEKFGVDSPADFKSDEEKKKFFDYIDKEWKADHEEEVKEEDEITEGFERHTLSFLKRKGFNVARFSYGKLLVPKSDVEDVKKVLEKEYNKRDGDIFELPKKIVGESSHEEEVKEEDEITEDVYDTLTNIVKKKSAQTVKFDNRKTLSVDSQTANVLIKVHDALRPQNQKKYRQNLAKGPNEFLKMVDFAWSNVS